MSSILIVGPPWVIPPIANSLSIARPDDWDTVPGAAGVLDGTQNQGLDVEHSGQKEAGIEDRAARARVLFIDQLRSVPIHQSPKSDGQKLAQNGKIQQIWEDFCCCLSQIVPITSVKLTEAKN
ncbi:hypothetical protein R3P38DRAFT_2796676 [Favolaschia claudopus]|uniref:Uncharacterized protein n=1 Tax=Favolaschia claudopus TaxID=2862362 RepID=A0AAW0A4U2_9AGAR